MQRVDSDDVRVDVSPPMPLSSSSSSELHLIDDEVMTEVHLVDIPLCESGLKFNPDLVPKSPSPPPPSPATTGVCYCAAAENSRDVAQECHRLDQFDPEVALIGM
jgi:hypothetical protein